MIAGGRTLGYTLNMSSERGSMERWVIWRPGRFEGCWECEGGGDADVWQAYAESPAEALRLVRDSIRLEYWDSPTELHCASLGASRARKARLLRPAEWLVDGTSYIDPPEFVP